MRIKHSMWILIALLLLLSVGMAETMEDASIGSIDDLAGKRIAIQTGTNYDQLLEEHESLRGKMSFSYYNTVTDMIQALKSGKTDAVPLDRPVAINHTAQSPELMILDEQMDTNSLGIAFQIGSPYVKAFNQALAELKQTGMLSELEAKWIGGPDDGKVLLEQTWDGKNGTLRYWADSEYEPLAYMGKGGALQGYDLDVVLHCAQIMGYRVEITPCGFDGLIPALVSNKADLVSSGFTITAERAKSVCFSDPYYTSSVVVVVRNSAPYEGKDDGFLASLSESFYKTFIREDRWKMFAGGIGNTLLITLLSALFGTLLGFAVYLLCRNIVPALTGIVELFFSFLERMPIVVLLMVLFYIVFGATKLGGVAVSIVAFTLTFAAAMYGMLKTGVDAVSFGQTEAAYALGYNKWDTFFKIILPQAARVFMPSYRSELISLVKGTSVVGYIAVQDLTKMSDIVRSRTYEAFFPLLTTAFIYILLTCLLTLLIKVVDTRIDPKHRKKESILKGVKQQ